MNNVTILHYDNEVVSVETLKEIHKKLETLIGGTIVMLPKNFDIMLDCSIDQLYNIKSIIDTAIAVKLNDEQIAMTGSPEYVS